MMLNSSSSTLPVEQERALTDLLEAERQLRLQAEANQRLLHHVLLDLAVRLDGGRIEDLRRENPNATLHWTALQWREFFAGIPAAHQAWPEAKRSTAREESLLRRQVDELNAQVEELEKQLQDADDFLVEDQKETPVPEEVIPSQPVEIEPGMIPPFPVLVAQARSQVSKLPRRAPEAFRMSGKVSGEDGKTSTWDLSSAMRLRRAYLILWLMGRMGINASLELSEIVGAVDQRSGSSGSLWRVLQSVILGGYAQAGILSLTSPRSSLKLLRLTTEGRRLYGALFGAEPVESEWERLIRLHEGERFQAHTLAVLIFSLHARKRGWATYVLPEVASDAAPDLLLKNGDERLYIEVELGSKEKPNKWRNLADLNSGKVALCAATPDTRQRLAGDCRLAKLPGWASDIETLVKVKYETISDAPTSLWVESW